jgi:hypothetical protein
VGLRVSAWPLPVHGRSRAPSPRRARAGRPLRRQHDLALGPAILHRGVCVCGSLQREASDQRDEAAGGVFQGAGLQVPQAAGVPRQMRSERHAR